MNDLSATCQIYVLLPDILSPALLRDLLEGLDKKQVTCILLKPPGSEQNYGQSEQGLTEKLIEICHSHDIALLVENDTRFALQIGADGVHLDAEASQEIENYENARKALGKEANIGVLCSNRHQALILAEMGADYVAFSETNEEISQEESHLKWWVAVVEVPCVAWDITAKDDITKYTQIGADFVSMKMPLWQEI